MQKKLLIKINPPKDNTHWAALHMSLPDKVKLCNEHDLFFQNLYQTMKICTEFRFTSCINIQHDTDATFFYDSKHSPTARQKGVLCTQTVSNLVVC